MRTIITASFLVIGVVTTALAGEPNFSRAYKSCMAASDSVTMKMRNCLANETQRFEGRLNRAYRILSGKLGDKQKDNLATAQQAWLRYRQLSCRYYATETGGSIDIITSNTCRLELTAHRTVELERVLKTYLEIRRK